jgi:prepilin-type processing-associated H-X9-DG protein
MLIDAMAAGTGRSGAGTSPISSPILFTPGGATLGSITNANGTACTALLSHSYVAPTAYGQTTDGTWSTGVGGAGACSVANPAMQPDTSKQPAQSSCLGGPHPNGNPTLFADNHVQSIPFSWATAQAVTGATFMWNWDNSTAFTLP